MLDNFSITSLISSETKFFEEEFAKYMRHYKRRGVTDIILSEAEKVSMRYIRYLIPKNGSFGRAKRYLVQKRKQMFGRK